MAQISRNQLLERQVVLHYGSMYKCEENGCSRYSLSQHRVNLGVFVEER